MAMEGQALVDGRCEVKCGGPVEAAGSMDCLVSTEVSSFVILRKEVGPAGSQPQATNRAVGYK